MKQLTLIAVFLSFAVPSWSQTVPAPNMRLGINAPTPTAGSDSQEITDIRDLGVGLVRCNVPAAIAANDGHLRGIMDIYQQTGARFVLTIPPSVSTASVLLTCQTLGKAVYALEGCNEPDNTSYHLGAMTTLAPILINQIAAVKLALKNAGLTVPIIGSAFTGQMIHAYFAPVGGTLPASMLQYIALFDMGGMHDYEPTEEWSEWNPTRQAWVAYRGGDAVWSRWLYRGKPFVVTEMGLSTSGQQSASLTEQAKYLPIMVKKQLIEGAESVMIYCLYDTGTDATNINQGYGLITAAGVRKPAFAAIANLCSTFK